MTLVSHWPDHHSAWSAYCSDTCVEAATEMQLRETVNKQPPNLSRATDGGLQTVNPRGSPRASVCM